MSQASDAALHELELLLEPLADEAIATLVSLIRQTVTHPDGVALAAARAAEALAAKAFIRS